MNRCITYNIPIRQKGGNLLWIAFVVLSSCLGKETPVPEPVPGNVETVQIEIGWPYTNQVYYDCNTNSVVASNTKYDWDLAFESSTTGDRILLNTAKGMLLANQGVVSFDTVQSTSGVKWLWDAPSGNLDSTAFGNWQGKSEVFIVDRQFGPDGKHLGYIRLQMISVNASSYRFKYANIDGSGEREYELKKSLNRAFTHFSFEGLGKTMELEPQRGTWDLLFTNHQHKFSNLTLPFVLTQALSNSYDGVLVAETGQYNFSEIVLSDTSNFTFTGLKNEIGYDWKIRNSQDNSFAIDPNKSFVIKTTEGWFFKLRFIDFYNDKGAKGYPKFEIQRL